MKGSKNINEQHDKMIFDAFEKLGYSKQWVMDNREHISVDHLSDQSLYDISERWCIDGEEVFQINQWTEFNDDGSCSIKIGIHHRVC